MVRQKYLDSICLLVVVLALVLSLVFLGGTSITGSAREPEDAGLSGITETEERPDLSEEGSGRSFFYRRMPAPGPMGQPSSSHATSSSDQNTRKHRL